MKNFNTKTIYILNAILFALVVLTFIYSIVSADSVPNAGGYYSNLQSELLQQTRRNEYLNYQLASVSSTSVIYQKALEGGYVKAQVDYLTIPALAYK